MFLGSLNGLEQVDGETENVENCDKEESKLVVHEVSKSYLNSDSPSECRLLSRSESAGDANIIDKLQSNKKTCSKSLPFNGEEYSEPFENENNSPGK